MHSSPVQRWLAMGVASLSFAPALAAAAYRDDVGFTKLQVELGATLPTGAGVVVTQAEAAVEVSGQFTWMPDPSNGEFIGKTITDISGAPAGIYSGHATAMGQYFYGNAISTSPGITTVWAYLADTWAFGDFLSPNGNDQPLSSSSRVANHSWVGTTGTGSVDADLLRRLDWVIENDDMLQVVGHVSSTPLLSSAFNVIAVSESGVASNSGSAAVDGTYTAGRARPDVVVPAVSPSVATALASSLVALLVETGHGNSALSTDPSSISYTNRAGLLIRNAERVEVIKAALMAGADRVTRNSAAADLALYRGSPADQTTNGLDLRYGAGQVNIRNSYWIMASGEQNSTEDGGAGSGSATRGFDYDPAFGGSSGTNSVANYPLPVSAVPQLLTAALMWNLDINGGTQNTFNGTAYFRDLALSVMDVANPGSPVTVFTSQSTTENTENAWLVIPAGGQYALRVTRASGSSFNYDYALAWQLLPDADADGAHDGQDNCTNVDNGPIVRDAGGNSQLDADADGYGNRCDGDLNNNNATNAQDYAIFRSKLGTADSVADLNGNGTVNAQDYAIFRTLLGSAPGPSGLHP